MYAMLYLVVIIFSVEFLSCLLVWILMCSDVLET